MLFYYNIDFDSIRNFATSYVTVKKIMSGASYSIHCSLDMTERVRICPWVHASDVNTLLSMLSRMIDDDLLSNDTEIDKLGISRALVLYKSGNDSLIMLKKLIKAEPTQCPHCLPFMTYEITLHRVKTAAREAGYDLRLCYSDACYGLYREKRFPTKHRSAFDHGEAYYFVAWLITDHERNPNHGLTYTLHPLTSIIENAGFIASMHPKQSYDHFHYHCFSKSERIQMTVPFEMEVSPLCYWTFSQLEELISIISGKYVRGEFPWSFDNTHMMSSVYLPVHHDVSPLYYEALITMTCIYGLGAIPLGLVNPNIRTFDKMREYHELQWANTSSVLQSISDEVKPIIEYMKKYLVRGKYSVWYIPTSKNIDTIRDGTLAALPEKGDLSLGGYKSQYLASSLAYITKYEMDLFKMYKQVWNKLCDSKVRSKVQKPNVSQFSYIALKATGLV